jgi:hypothetical protein
MAESSYVRTKVKARNPEKGVYRTLDGSHEIRQADKKGCWDVYRLLDGGAQKIAGEVKGYDRALDHILEEPGVTLEALNTPPAKPKPEAKPEAKAEQTESDRRSGATGPAPKAPAKGRPHVNRGGRKIA